MPSYRQEHIIENFSWRLLPQLKKSGVRCDRKGKQQCFYTRHATHGVDGLNCYARPQLGMESERVGHPICFLVA